VLSGAAVVLARVLIVASIGVCQPPISERYKRRPTAEGRSGPQLAQTAVTAEHSDARMPHWLWLSTVHLPGACMS
jgi:hypothetical protein